VKRLNKQGTRRQAKAEMDSLITMMVRARGEGMYRVKKDGGLASLTDAAEAEGRRHKVEMRMNEATRIVDGELLHLE
jgi:hypothetical protein